MKKESVIKILRNQIGISQQDLAKRLNITRQSLTKYENDTDSIPIPILRKLSSILGVDYKTIMENKLTPDSFISHVNKSESEVFHEFPTTISIECTPQIRNDPVDRFNQIFLHILIKIGSRPNIGKGALCKILYLISYNYYKRHLTEILHMNFVRTESGPVPYSFANLIYNMQQERLIEEVCTTIFCKENIKYLPTKEPILDTITAEDLYFINSEIEKYGDFTNEELLTIISANKSYQATEVDDVIDYLDEPYE